MDIGQRFELSETLSKASTLENGATTYYSRDEAEMAQLGRTQILKRNWGFWSILGLNCTIMVTWEYVLIVFTSGLENGGSAGLIWGYLIIWLGIICVFITMAELASMAPSSGGQYHWVFILAPRSMRKGLSFLTGWLTTIGWQATVTGPDGAIHMSEEIHNASTVVPWTLLASTILSGLFGFGMLIAILFCLDLEAAMSSPEEFSFVKVYLQATNSTTLTATVLMFVIISLTCATISCLAATSRMIWSFARDRGLPGWQVLSQVESRTAIPDVCIAFTTAIACALALINIGSTVVFTSIISFSVNALYLPYLLCAVLLLWRRCTGAITESREKLPQTPNQDGIQLAWGPWRIAGWPGILVNVLGIVYLTVITFFSFWPAVTPVTSVTMNYSAAVFGLVAVFGMVYYFVHASKTYCGPVMERGA
ncbi:hypothetical protein MMC10_001818 [Thelotrema lepadinum]|nr:hypothetical protein [Thelotrema lepadinum]